MQQIKKHLEKAYVYISKVQVSGNNVEPMAMARMELREAYKELEAKKKEVEGNAADENAVCGRS